MNKNDKRKGKMNRWKASEKVKKGKGKRIEKRLEEERRISKWIKEREKERKGNIWRTQKWQ